MFLSKKPNSEYGSLIFEVVMGKRQVLPSPYEPFEILVERAVELFLWEELTVNSEETTVFE